MMQTLRRQGMRQRADNMILSDQSIERAGTPFARKDQITHEVNRPQTEIKEASLTSALDAVRGIGRVRKAQLMDRFGSFEAVRAATLDELSALSGFNRKLAEAIRSSLSSSPKTEGAGE
jgi:ERCC4-type nuclease